MRTLAALAGVVKRAPCVPGGIERSSPANGGIERADLHIAAVVIEDAQDPVPASPYLRPFHFPSFVAIVLDSIANFGETTVIYFWYMDFDKLDFRGNARYVSNSQT